MSTRVVTVVIYLEDHSRDDRALTVKPRTHGLPHGYWAPGLPFNAVPNQTEQALRTSLGDVVIFDARLWHRGMERSHEKDCSQKKVPRRRCLSFDFGAWPNELSNRVHRAYAVRNSIINGNQSVCGGRTREQPNVRKGPRNKAQACVLKWVRADAARLARTVV